MRRCPRHTADHGRGRRTRARPAAHARRGRLDRQFLQRDDLCAILTSATTFVCPSIYEPLGIVASRPWPAAPPSSASATGGIPEVVADGVTGRLVPIDQVQDGTGTPTDPDRFVADLAATLAEVVADPERARAYGAAGRERAATAFSWQAIADATESLYREVAQPSR
ncbi:MAG: glycosyltransferase [Microbacterium sp.]